ncbi:SapC family protein [Hyphobacterium sp.]|uniref:SapC family protein n=1 Tax=Hyphobacterium sp. TaxID=2004662 RepID=UPI003BA85E7C
MADASATPPQLTGQVPMYKRPEPLNKEKHRNYGMSAPARPFGFLADTHFVPAIVGEFPLYAGHFPVIFLGEKKMPVVVMGLRNGENLFVTEDGQFDKDAMLPAFVRRYPFVSAANGPDQPATVCIDMEADGIGENADMPFFDANGEPTEALQQSIDFVSAFEADARTTETFVNRLIELDLFEDKDVTLNDPNTGQTQKVADYSGISEQKLNALPDETYMQLRTDGYLPAIYCHLISLNRWDRILNRAFLRQQAANNQKAQ